MLRHVKKYSAQRNAPEWAKEFVSILTPSGDSGGDTQETAEGDDEGDESTGLPAPLEQAAGSGGAAAGVDWEYGVDKDLQQPYRKPAGRGDNAKPEYGVWRQQLGAKPEDNAIAKWRDGSEWSCPAFSVGELGHLLATSPPSSQLVWSGSHKNQFMVTLRVGTVQDSKTKLKKPCLVHMLSVALRSMDHRAKMTSTIKSNICGHIATLVY